MPKTIDDLREHLFGTLDALRDEKNPMDIERAKAVAEVAGVIVDSARVEAAFSRANGGSASAFMPTAPALPDPQQSGRRRLGHGNDVAAGAGSGSSKQ
ncbi:MAG: hypothetical protein ACRDQZ_25275 [Mycobacteriales bacterium]